MSWRRIAVFQFHDDKGIVYAYVENLLRGLLESIEELHIVCSGYLREESRRKFMGITPHVHERVNIGYSWGAWQAVFSHISFPYLRTFDELILLDDSFFGPWETWSEIFSCMQSQQVDFWGMTAQGEGESEKQLCPYGFLPRRLQAYFLAFRSRLLHDARFERFWTELEVPAEELQAQELCEAVMTQKFLDWGFSYGTYVDTEDLESTDRSKNMPHQIFNVYEMVANRNLPVISRKAFSVSKTESLLYGAADSLPQAMRYISDYTNYDTSLIWQYLLANYNMADLHEHLNLYYALPEQAQTWAVKKIDRTAIVAHLYYDDLFDYYMGLFEYTPQEIDLIITTNTEEKRLLLEQKYLRDSAHNWKVLVVREHGREWSARLVACRGLLDSYEYLCFLHDKKSAQKEFPTVGSEFASLLVENLLASEGYVRNVLAKFESEPHLGVLAPTNVYWGTYFHSWIDFWTLNYDVTYELLCRLGIEPNIAREKPPVSMGSDFWCRREAIEPLLAEEWKYADFTPEPLPADGALNHALERVFPYIAQAQGYYTGTVMTLETAGLEADNFRYMMHRTLRTAARRGKGLDWATFARFRETLSKVR